MRIGKANNRYPRETEAVKMFREFRSSCAAMCIGGLAVTPWQYGMCAGTMHSALPRYHPYCPVATCVSPQTQNEWLSVLAVSQFM